MKKQTIVIRPFDGATDVRKLSDIWLDASLLAHPFIGEKKLIEQKRLIEEKYLPAAETWVACLADEPVGFIRLLSTFVGAIFVAPDSQGQGIGRQLIAYAIDKRVSFHSRSIHATSKPFSFIHRLVFRKCCEDRLMMKAFHSKMRIFI